MTSLVLCSVASAPAWGFDAGSTDPNSRQIDSLIGDKSCLAEVGFLQVSGNITQLLLTTDRTGALRRYYYNGGFYRSSSNAYSTNEANYTRSTADVDRELTSVYINDIASECGWTSATFTDNTPSSGFADVGTSFADASTASVTIDYIYNNRNFSFTLAITGTSSQVPTVTSVYTATPNAPTALSPSAGNGQATISFTAPSDLASFTQAGEEDNAITNYEYSIDNGANWTALSPTDSTSPVTITGLTNGTTYAVKLRAVNGVGPGGASSTVSVTPSGPDTTAPSFDVAPSVGSVTSTGFTPSASIDEAGVIYYVVVADGASAPTAAEVKAGTASGGGSALAAASATVSSSPFTSSFSAITSLSASTAYDVYFVAQDDEGTPNLQSSVTKVDATTSAAPDTTAPTLASSNPADNATGVAVGSNIVLTFSEAVDTETGVITIKRVSDASTVESFDVASSGAISGSGTTTITINPTSDLASSTAYYVEIASSAFDDAAGNSYAGISGATTLNFTTADIVAPAITGPSGGAGATTSAITVNENQTAVTQLRANETVTWSLSGADAAKFAIAADGTLTFLETPDFENPTDVGAIAGNNTYVVIITATDISSNASSQTLTVTVANVEDTPAEAFAANAQTIRQIVTDEANRSLRNTVSANQNMVQSALDRFVADVEQNAACDEDGGGVSCTEAVVTRNYIPFDVDGVFRLSGTTLSTNGTFFGQQGNADGTWRRLFFGDFNVQRDANTGSNTATLSARVAWEQMVSDTTMLGYFIGAELAESDLKGSFTGDQNRVALTLGGYAVHQLAEQVYLDGFLTVGAGRNDLKMANAVLALDSDYTTRTATLGAAVSGIYEYEAYEFHPELSFSYGHTWIGNVGFTGRAYGLVDNTLSLNAGNLSMGNLIFRPEIIWGLDAASVADSNSQLSLAPRMICEQTRSTRRTEACGGGAELGLGTQSDDGLTNAEFRVLMDRVGSSERTSYAIKLEHRF